jgi:glycosyltransferase involved in cell wall biosynthesis
MNLCSVIICTRDRAQSLVRTLAHLNSVQVPPGFGVELIVADNGSRDDTAEQVKRACIDGMAIRYLSEPRPGQCHARNAGIAAAKGDIIIFLDDDVLPPADWLNAMCLPIMEGKADAVAGGIVLAPQLNRHWMDSVHRSWLASTEQLDAASPPTLVGGNMAFSRKVLERVPQFDTELGPGRMGFGDDTLFGYQVRAAGFRVASAFHAPVQHHFDPSRLTRASFLEAARKHGRSGAYLDRHWRHQLERWPRLKLIWAALRLAVWRAGKPGEWFRKEGASAAELHHVMNLHRLKQYAREIRRPASYEPRGLVKKVSTASPD